MAILGPDLENKTRESKNHTFEVISIEWNRDSKATEYAKKLGSNPTYNQLRDAGLNFIHSTYDSVNNVHIGKVYINKLLGFRLAFIGEIKYRIKN